MWPEPYATIAREREKGTTTAKLAEMLGVHITTVNQWIRKWNRDNPDNPLPRHAHHTRTPRYVEAANHHKAGKTLAETAEIMGVKKVSVTGLWSKAREHGLLPRSVPRVRQGGFLAYEAYQKKGAAPLMGNFRDILNPLDAEEIERLINTTDPRNDAILAHTIARILKEHLRDRPKGR